MKAPLMNDTLQDRFTSHLAKTREEVTVFLTNGVKLTGKITYNDHWALTLNRDGVTQLIFKHAIATVMPKNAIDMTDIMPQ